MRLVGGISLVLSLFLVSCFDFPYYSESYVVDSSGWQSTDSLRFNFNIADSTNRYNCAIDLSHTENYPFSNIYLFVDFEFPNGKNRVDTVHIPLADRTGRWYGSGLGDMTSLNVALYDGFAFPITGNYSVTVIHGMRRDPLEGITDLGFRLEELPIQKQPK